MPSYEGFAFRQNQYAPYQVVFVAPTCDVDGWAKVPTRLSGRPKNFQRAALKSHVQEINRFFSDDTTRTNSSPTSILIGIDPSRQSTVTVQAPAGGKLDLSTLTATPVPCLVDIDFPLWMPPDDGDVDKSIASLYTQVAALWDAEPEAVEADDEESSTEDEDAADDAQHQGSAGPPDADGAVLAPSTTEVSGSPDVSDEDEDEDQTEDDPADMPAHLSVAQLRRVLDSGAYREWDVERKQSLLDTLKDEPKPGLIIDGQHRVRATRDLPDVPFVITMLPDASWAELAFQFIVNNSSAKKVDDNLLFAIVGESLEPSELQGIEGRLNRSGIKVNLIKASMRVHLESNPFSGMLRTNTPGEKGFLDATAMQKKVIELWYGSRGRTGTSATLKKFRAISDDPGQSKQYRIIDLFAANCEAATTRERSEEWQEDLWFDYFKAFWNAVSERYVGEGLWPQTADQWPAPAGQGGVTPDQKATQNLMGATILGMTQLAVLQRWAERREERCADDGKDYTKTPISPEEFQQQIANILKPVKSEFFHAYIRSGADASKQVKQTFIRALTDVLKTVKTVEQVKAAYPTAFKQ